MLKNIICFITLAIISSNSFAGNFQLVSPDLVSGKQINMAQVLNAYGCHGKNISPQLSWENAPTETKSFAVTMYDPDALSGKGWWHWIVFNIPVTVTHLDQNAGNTQLTKLPVEAIQSQISFNSTGYSGPCPPLGDKPHRYIVTVYALKQTLPLDSKSSAELVDRSIQKNKLASASIIAMYHR